MLSHIFSLYFFFLRIQILNIRNSYRIHPYLVYMVRYVGVVQVLHVQNVTTPPHVYEQWTCMFAVWMNDRRSLHVADHTSLDPASSLLSSMFSLYHTITFLFFILSRKFRKTLCIYIPNIFDLWKSFYFLLLWYRELLFICREFLYL